jgi:hypothetical protein
LQTQEVSNLDQSAAATQPKNDDTSKNKKLGANHRRAVLINDEQASNSLASYDERASISLASLSSMMSISLASPSSMMSERECASLRSHQN